MKVYYISSGLQGCYFLRCLLPLQANGWDGDQTSIRLESKSPENKKNAAMASEVVVFHRPDDPRKLELAKILKTQRKKIVFDNDDTAKHDGGFRFNDLMNEERVKNALDTINSTIDTFVREADLITCSTEFLAEEYRKINDKVVVLPNCVDPFYFDEPQRNQTDVVRIGIVGSLAITDDLNIIEPIVRHFNGNPKVKMVVFSLPPNSNDTYARSLYKHEYDFYESMDIEWQPFVPMQDYYETLNKLRLDMMIIPRADNYFNRAKSNVKFLEASMFEIPVIAQGFPDGRSPYEVDKEDAKHMIIVKDNKDWIPEIEELAHDETKRKRMGKAARKYVEEKYSIENNAHLWVEAYESIK
jgi:glycosyltransferase involved in cell wall biosynthesis